MMGRSRAKRSSARVQVQQYEVPSMARTEGNVGAVAFSRTGDPGSGEFADAVVLKLLGTGARRFERAWEPHLGTEELHP
jgi:hypothetical protein